MKKRLRILVLMHPDHVPPDSTVGATDEEKESWKAEFQITRTLKSLGHEVKKLGVYEEVVPIRNAVADWKPDIVFNLMDEFRGQAGFDQHVVAYLELLGVPYTGCNPRGMTIARDKALTKKIMAYHRIAVPRFAVFRKRRRIKRPTELTFPVIVKSLIEEASLGISQASIVDSDEKLVQRVEFIHNTIGTHAIAEQYIDGRELYVGVLGLEKLTILPPWELFMDKLPEGSSPIATRKVKWDPDYQERHKIMCGPAEVDEELARKLKVRSRRIYKHLGLSGYARMDYRLRADGKIFLLEANPNPGIARGDEMPLSAKAADISYEAFLTRILRLALNYEPGAIY